MVSFPTSKHSKTDKLLAHPNPTAQLAGTSFQEYREMATDGIDLSVPSSPSAVSSWNASSPLSGSALMFLSEFQGKFSQEFRSFTLLKFVVR